MQRFYLTLELYDNDALIDEYAERHQRVWPEVLATLREAGVVEMQIYRAGTRLFMVMETTDDFTFERKAALDQASPVVMQWEREMAKYQVVEAGADASAKWQPACKVFDLAEQIR